MACSSFPWQETFQPVTSTNIVCFNQSLRLTVLCIRTTPTRKTTVFLLLSMERAPNAMKSTLSIWFFVCSWALSRSPFIEVQPVPVPASQGTRALSGSELGGTGRPGRAAVPELPASIAPAGGRKAAGRTGTSSHKYTRENRYQLAQVHTQHHLKLPVFNYFSALWPFASEEKWRQDEESNQFPLQLLLHLHQTPAWIRDTPRSTAEQIQSLVTSCFYRTQVILEVTSKGD